MLFSYPPGSLRISTRQRLFHSQIASLKTHSSIYLVENHLLGPLQKSVASRRKKRELLSVFLFFSSVFKKNTLEVYVTHSQVAVNLMPRVPNFSRDQHDICVDIKHVFFCVLSFSKCQWLFKTIDNPGLLQHLHMYC